LLNLGRGGKKRERERNSKIERDSLLFGEKVTPEKQNVLNFYM
jgi:hypothetical protein